MFIRFFPNPDSGTFGIDTGGLPYGIVRTMNMGYCTAPLHQIPDWMVKLLLFKPEIFLLKGSGLHLIIPNPNLMLLKANPVLLTSTCVIVESDSLLANRCANFISVLNGLELLEIYNSPEKANAIRNQEQVDFLFMEVGQGNSMGFEMAKKLRDRVKFIVFMSAYPGSALDAFQAGGDQFLLKPILFQTFFTVVNALITKERQRDGWINCQVSEEKWLNLPILNDDAK